MQTAVVYVRVSTEEQVSNLSLDTQEASCRAYCDRSGWRVARVYREEGESAKTTQRPELQRMLGELETWRGQRPSTLVVYDIWRFARETIDHLLIRRQLSKLGVVLRASTQQIDESPEGELMETLLAAMGKWDNAARSRRSKAGMRAALDRGRWVWQAPRGYRHVDGALVVHEKEAGKIRTAFARIASGGWTVEDARRAAAAEGLDVPHASWYALLSSPLYVGRVESRTWGVVTQGAHEAIVDAATWERVQERLTRPAGAVRRAYRAGGTVGHPLKGLLHCSACDRPMTGEVVKRWSYYRCPRCRRSARVERVDSALVAMLDAVSVAPEVLDLFAEILAAKLDAEAATRGDRAESARRKLAGAEARAQRLLDLVTEGTIDPAAYRRQAERVEAERSAAAAELCDATATDRPGFQLALEAGASILTRPADAWLSLPPASRPQWARVVLPDGLTWDGDELSNRGKSLWNLPFALDPDSGVRLGTPSGIRTRVAALKGRCPDLARRWGRHSCRPGGP